MPFDLQPVLAGDLVELRPLREDDFPALFAVASDPLIWEQHPEPDRCTEPVFRQFFQGAIESGGAFVALDRQNGRLIGSSRFSGYDEARGEIEIGWTFLARSHWGGSYNREMKRLMLAHAFRFVRRVVFRIGPDNRRSRRAIEKIGASFVGFEPSGRSGQSALYEITREAAAASWPALAAELDERDVRAFCDAVSGGDVARARDLLATPHVRSRVNDPMFAFGQRAAHIAAKSREMLTVLMAAGADVNLKSDWQNGPYTVLDNADEDTARFLLAHGAALTPNVAARLGWMSELQRLLDANRALVHARGGDGQQPLHEAKTVAIVDVLLDHGADIDERCIDHRSTPAQYALVDRPDVCRRLLERGATPDIFMAARLGDAALAARLVDADPGCLGARINEPGYGAVPAFNVYCWSLGFGVSPHAVADRFGHHEVRDLLTARSPARLRFINAVTNADEAAVNAALAEEPSLLASLGPHDHARLAQAVFHGQFEAAGLMLRLGFDPAAPGVDGGTALHAACWVGNVGMVERLLARGGVPLDARDPTHQSTPLGWTAFGSVHRRAAGANYAAVAERLVAAGADITLVGNGAGRTLVEMAKGNVEMQAALRRLGAF